MKYLLSILLILVTVKFAQGQVQAGHQLLKGSSKSRLYYVDIKNNEAKVYTMGRYLDVAGSGYSIMRTDTLPQQADGSYAGRQSRIIRKYTRLTNHIIKSIQQIDYAALRDSVAQLPAEYAGKSQYYSKVMNTVVVSQPEYFLRLAEDFPQDRSLIFSSVVDNKQARTTIESVMGHDNTRNAFLKERKEYKSLPYKAIGIATLGAGLLILIGIHLFK